MSTLFNARTHACREHVEINSTHQSFDICQRHRVDLIRFATKETVCVVREILSIICHPFLYHLMINNCGEALKIHHSYRNIKGNLSFALLHPCLPYHLMYLDGAVVTFLIFNTH